jgi:hypothetical protein
MSLLCLPENSWKRRKLFYLLYATQLHLGRKAVKMVLTALISEI